jgi:hypothetical protein
MQQTKSGPLAAADDLIVRLINAKLLASLIGQSRPHVIADGHLFLITRATSIAPVVRNYLIEG